MLNTVPRAHTTANKTELARQALDSALEIAPYDSKLLSVKGELLAVKLPRKLPCIVSVCA